MIEKKDNPLRVLIAEDIKDRQEILISLYRSHAWILVDTAYRAARLVQAYDFDVISLDYNLKGEETGADIANTIRYSRNSRARVIIHSMNPDGAQEIKNILPEGIIYPVSKMIRSNRAFKEIRSKIDALGVTYNWE